MDFGEVLGRAWRIIWKHKILWIFGIFAGCSRGGGGGGGNGYRFSGSDNIPQQTGPLYQSWLDFSNWVSNHPWVIALAVILALVLVIIAIILGTVGRIGLIKGTQKADGGAEHLGFAELWDQSLPFFWRVFLLALIVGVASFVVVIALILLGIGAAVITLGIGLICLVPLFCVLVIALWFASLVIQMAEIAIVTENLGIMDGVRRGWDVVKRSPGPVLIMWLILAVIGFVAALVIAIPVLVAVVPAAIAFAASNSQGAAPNWAPLIIGLACCAVYFPFLLVLNGILSAYLESAWTLTFLRLAGLKPTAEPKDVPPENPIVPAPNA